jgi:hypothetical protein
MSDDTLFPALPIEEWEETKDTLHLYLQIIGKIRLALFPRMNHWWHVPFYVTPRGVTTRPIPWRDMQFEMDFDFLGHAFTITTSRGEVRSIPLDDSLSVSLFYKTVFAYLAELGIQARIWGVPYDVPAIGTERFELDTRHASYDPQYANRYWRVLLQVDSVFQAFRCRFIGKSTPPHLFWHHFDLALTRFSGRKAPEREGAGVVEREAYSHEVLSFGFWAGDDKVREPAFYAYAYPVPEGLYDEPIRPAKAFWNREAGMALYLYNDMREESSPREALMDFLESVYRAGAKRAKWDVEGFRLPG